MHVYLFVRGLCKINKRLLTWKEENHFVELSILSRFLQHAVTTSFSKEARDEYLIMSRLAFSTTIGHRFFFRDSPVTM